jgi:hypothetical protein
MSITRYRSGTIAYLSDKTEDRGRKRGFETFTITEDSDGTLTQRALCEIQDPPFVQRDITQYGTAAMRPLDCYVRIRTGEKPPFVTGGSWFRFGEDVAECEGDTTADGRISQRHPLSGGPVGFCNHSIVGDAWMIANYPLAQGPGEFLVKDFILPTLSKQGATGPRLAHANLAIQFVGRESITVGAGTFDCLHFRTSSFPPGGTLKDAHYAYNMWCTDDGLYMAVLSGYLGERRYELMSLRDAP